MRVLNSEFTGQGDLLIRVESTQRGTTCRRCGREIAQSHGYDRARRLRHLPLFERRVYLEICPTRYRCGHCEGGPTTTQRCAWYEPNSSYTRAFEHDMRRALINSTVAAVSRKHGLSEASVEGIVERDLAQQSDWSTLEWLGMVGIDEIALRKGHRDCVVIVTRRDAEGQLRVLGVLADRHTETVAAFLKGIPEWLKATIKQGGTDRYEGFINAAHEELPEADVVVDRFHVAKVYRGCADAVPKQELKRLKQELPKAEYEALTKETRWPFRPPWKTLNRQERQRVERLFEHAPALGTVHLMREILTVIFDTAESKAQATAWLGMWREFLSHHAIEGFDRFLTTLDNHLDEITNYFRHRQTSGCVEGFNNKIKGLKRRCYGLFNLSHLFQRLQLDLEGYHLCGTA